MINTFQPIHDSSYRAFLVFAALALLALVGTIFLILTKSKTPKQRNLKQMLAMLLFFVTLISASTAFFSYWRFLELTPIEVKTSSLLINGQEIPFDQILKIEIDQNPQHSLINQSIAPQTAPLLKVQTNNEQLLVISKKQYDIDTLFLTLRKAIDTWKDNR